MSKKHRKPSLVATAIGGLGILTVSLMQFAIGTQQRRAALVRPCAPGGEINRERFASVMQTISEGWNRGDARLAASFFGGSKGRELPMHMTWHHLVFDPVQQIGVGEYTFTYRMQTHGLVIVKMSRGLVLNWREYEVESNLPWDQWVGENRF
jgi:hypothetical protein